MTRIVTSANETESLLARQGIGILASLDFSSGFVRVVNRDHSIDFGGNTYLGLGRLGSISGVAEDTGLRPNSVNLTLSGIDPAMVATALTEDYHGRQVILYQAWFDESNQLKATPETIFRGYMDFMTVALGKSSATITLACENEFAGWSRAKVILFADASQKLLYSADTAFDQVPYLKDKIVRWGGERVAVPSVSDNSPDISALGFN